MDDLLSIAVSNAVAATVLALVALAVGAVYRRPALIHGLWLLVLLKLMTPPLLYLPISWPSATESSPQASTEVREETTMAPSVDEETNTASGVASAPREDTASGVASAPREDTASGVASAPREDTASGVASAPREDTASGVASAPREDTASGVASAPREDTASGVASAPREEALGALTQPRSPLSLWLQILSLVWAIGALTWFMLALERLQRFRRLLRFAQPASAALQERTRRLAQSLGLKRCPHVQLLPGRITPMLWAIGGSPRLLVPAGLLDLLNDEQLDTLLLHELAHLRRRDHWVRVFEFVVMGLYWWHPVVWYARRELREAEEQCCDAWVVSMLPESGRTYATALLDTLDFLSTAQVAVPPLASGLGQIADLKRRLTMIMRGNTPRSLTWPGCLAVLAVGLTVLPMLPSLQGQAPSKADPAKSVEEAKKKLDEAKARLEQAKAQLEADKARMAVAEEQLKKADAERVYKQAIQQAQLVRQKAASRIVITVDAPADAKADEVKLIIESIRKALPEKLRSGIKLRIGVLGANSMAPLPPLKSSETRINELENKLEKVLREVHALRKQMQPYGGPWPAYVPPSSPVPPGISYPGKDSNRIAPATPPPANNSTQSPSSPNKLVPAPAAPRPRGENRPAPTPRIDPQSSENPYEAPTVPLKNAPVDPTRP